jgi:hypothetical protein
MMIEPSRMQDVQSRWVDAAVPLVRSGGRAAGKVAQRRDRAGGRPDGGRGAPLRDSTATLAADHLPERWHCDERGGLGQRPIRPVRPAAVLKRTNAT